MVKEILYDMSRNAHQRDTGSKNVFEYNGAGTDLDAVGNANAAKNLGALSDIYIIADDR